MSSADPVRRPLPKAPVLDWASFAPGRVSPHVPTVQDLPQHIYTTSGRAAIYQALKQLGLPPNSLVLVPTYHCPTMVAPLIHAGLRPLYFGLDQQGLPDIAALTRSGARGARAMIAAHYFGLPRSFALVRQWCDANGVALIEDCAHCYFGQAGELPAGQWGDFATASLSKFFPVPEAGLLGSARHRIEPPILRHSGLKAQLKGWVDVLEFATRHRRLAGLRLLLGSVFAMKNRGLRGAPVEALPVFPSPVQSEDAMMKDCDMARIDDEVLSASMALNALLPRHRVIACRVANFAAYQRAFADVPGARPLFSSPPQAAAPYVFPLWVDDADRVYKAVRLAALPIFRWDRIWPGTPNDLRDDVGPLWSRHVLQLLCHQDLRPGDIAHTIAALRQMLKPEMQRVSAEVCAS